MFMKGTGSQRSFYLGQQTHEDSLGHLLENSRQVLESNLEEWWRGVGSTLST